MRTDNLWNRKALYLSSPDCRWRSFSRDPSKTDKLSHRVDQATLLLLLPWACRTAFQINGDFGRKSQTFPVYLSPQGMCNGVAWCLKTRRIPEGRNSLTICSFVYTKYQQSTDIIALCTLHAQHADDNKKLS